MKEKIRMCTNQPKDPKKKNVAKAQKPTIAPYIEPN